MNGVDSHIKEQRERERDVREEIKEVMKGKSLRMKTRTWAIKDQREILFIDSERCGGYKLTYQG